MFSKELGLHFSKQTIKLPEIEANLSVDMAAKVYRPRGAPLSCRARVFSRFRTREDRAVSPPLFFIGLPPSCRKAINERARVHALLITKASRMSKLYELTLPDLSF